MFCCFYVSLSLLSSGPNNSQIQVHLRKRTEDDGATIQVQSSSLMTTAELLFLFNCLNFF